MIHACKSKRYAMLLRELALLLKTRWMRDLERFGPSRIKGRAPVYPDRFVRL
jgi:hypothetical protein